MPSIPQGVAQAPGAAPVLTAVRSPEGGWAELGSNTARSGWAEPSVSERLVCGEQHRPKSSPEALATEERRGRVVYKAQGLAGAAQDEQRPASASEQRAWCRRGRSPRGCRRHRLYSRAGVPPRSPSPQRRDSPAEAAEPAGRPAESLPASHSVHRPRAQDTRHRHGHATGVRTFIERARGGRGWATARPRARCRPHSRNFHSWRHMGQCCCTCCEFSHLRMQCMWKQCEHCPHTNGQSSPGTLPAVWTHRQPRPVRSDRCQCRSRTHSRGSSR